MGARVLFVTQHEILGAGITPRLLAEPGISMVSVAHEGKEALRMLAADPYDVAIVEADLPDLRAVDVIERAKDARARVRCIALVEKSDRADLDAVMSAGAAGIISVFSPTRTLVQAVACVYAGRCFVSEDVTTALVSGVSELGVNRTSGHDAATLTRREREVLRLIAEDCSSREISNRLGISPRTVETHRARLMDKLQVRKTASLVRIAIQQGLVALDSTGLSPPGEPL